MIKFGGAHLKRVSVTIQFKNHPENTVNGYALSHEILPNQVSFFAAQKFPVDEELNVFYTVNGEKKSLTVTMKSMHEQISSGRIMNGIPSEENPFPARKFYRCYTSVVGAAAAAATDTNTDEKPSEAPAPVEVAAEAPMEAAPAAEVIPVAKMDSSDVFGAEEPVSVPIPDVDELNKAA